MSLLFAVVKYITPAWLDWKLGGVTKYSAVSLSLKNFLTNYLKFSFLVLDGHLTDLDTELMNYRAGLSVSFVAMRENNLLSWAKKKCFLWIFPDPLMSVQYGC